MVVFWSFRERLRRERAVGRTGRGPSVFGFGNLSERSMAIADQVDVEIIPDTTASLRRIVWSSVIGTAVEWYDFLIYGPPTALGFNKIFFPPGHPPLPPTAPFPTHPLGSPPRPLS